jgi:hypothetical protein
MKHRYGTISGVDEERILCIPLNEHLTEDFVAWHKTKSSFLVRSAYYIKWDTNLAVKLEGWTVKGSSRSNPVWEVLWKLNMPSKVLKNYIEIIAW